MDQYARSPLPGVVLGGSPTTNKEAQTSRALLVLHERLAQASTYNKQQLARAAAAFEQQLAGVAAASAAKQEALSERLVEQCRRRRQLLLLSSCVLAWRCQQQLQQQHSLRRQTLAVALTAWQQAVQCIRYVPFSANCSCSLVTAGCLLP